MTFAKVCHQITENGICLDIPRTELYVTQLTKEIEEIDAELIKIIPDKQKKMPTLKNIFRKDSTPTAKMTEWIGSGNPYRITNSDNGNCDMERWLIVPASLGDPKTLKNYMLDMGWIPREDFECWNYKVVRNIYSKMEKVKGPDNKYVRTSPKTPTDDEELESLKHIPGCELIAVRSQKRHRLGLFKGFLENCGRNGRIKMGINSCGAATGRVTHSVVANIPRSSSYFGNECRSVLCTTPGTVLVGCDESGLELRVMAHYINDPVFTDLILNGDIHQFFYEKLKDFVKDRSSGKNLTYAMVYGAGDEKLGSMCDKILHTNNKRAGELVREAYIRAIPNLGILINALEYEFHQKRGITGLDGRFISCRKKFALLNTLCQSAGAIISKEWTNRFKELMPDEKIVGFIHDEILVETTDERALLVGQTLVNCIIEAGEHFGLDIPLSGEFKVGKNWSEVH